MIQDVEKHLRDAVTTSNRNFFARYLEHRITITRNIIGTTMARELQLWVNDWNNIVQHNIDEAARLGENIYEEGPPFVSSENVLKCCYRGITMIMLEPNIVEPALKAMPTLNPLNPKVFKANQYQLVIELQKGDFEKLSRTAKGGYVNIVSDVLLGIYQDARSTAFDELEKYTGDKIGWGRGKNKDAPGRTTHTDFTASGRERNKLIKAHGKIAYSGGQLVTQGKTQTTVAVLSVAKEWRKFKKGKIKTKVKNRTVLGMMGQVRTEITDALATEYNIHRWTKDSTYGGIKDFTKVDIHATDAKGNTVMAKFDKKGIREFIHKKAADIHKKLTAKYAHLEPHLETSMTKAQRARRLANLVLIEQMLKIKVSPSADMRLRVNKKLLADAKKVKKRLNQKRRGTVEPTGRKTKKKTVAARAAGSKVSATKPKGRSAGTAKTAQSPIALRNLLNELLPAKVAQNMGSPALNYITGRFANSARVELVNQGPRGGTSIDYTYMKFPYQTFEPGFAQGSTMRDPRKIIGESIRELATGILGRQPHTIRRT